MSFEPIGALTIIVGVYCLLLGIRSTIIAFVVACTLGSAAAFLIGGGNIQPAHLYLLFLSISTLFWRRFSIEMLNGLKVAEPGFWLFCLVIYGVLSAYLMPRLFAGETYIIPLGTSEYLTTSNGVVPLGPVSSNLTQSIYLAGDLLCFMIVRTIGSSVLGITTLSTALITYSAVNIGFGALDLLTSATGTSYILQFIRNAQYTFHDEESIGSLRRIIGSWPEASAFAVMTLGGFGYTSTLWLRGQTPLLSGTLAIMSLLFVVLSTSSTGLVGAGVLLLVLYFLAILRCSTDPRDRFSAAAVILWPLIILAAGLIIIVSGNAAQQIYDYLSVLVLNKSSSDSGIERATWNLYAWRNFVDTWGLGVGLGTNRSSSFPLALLSNIGIPGAVFYALFLVSVFTGGRGAVRSYVCDVRSASRMGCLAILTGTCLAGPTVDQTLLFYVFAGVACSFPERGSALSETRRPKFSTVGGG